MGGRGPFLLPGTGGIGRTVLTAGGRRRGGAGPFPDYFKEMRF